MKFYFAGKVAVNDWRHSIIKDLRTVRSARIDNESDLLMLRQKWPVMENVIFGEHSYTGPYFIGDDHGCYHGRSSHGNGENGCFGSLYGPDGDVSGGHGPYPEETRRHIIRLCLHAVAESDVVFVWVDSNTMYGTLFELGFALAYRKPIWWAEKIGNYDLDDMWFAKTSATDVTQSYNAMEALRHFIKKHVFKIDGYVYILQSGQHYKIGKTKSVDQRVAQISPKTPMPIKLLHSIACDDMSWAETQLHRHFASYRTNGEWFLLPQDQLTWLLSLKTISRAIPFGIPTNP